MTTGSSLLLPVSPIAYWPFDVSVSFFAAASSPLPSHDRRRVDAGVVEQLLVDEGEEPDVDIERDAPKMALVIGRLPRAREEGVGLHPGLLGEVVERHDGAGLGEGRVPDLVDGRDIRPVARLHRRQEPLLVFGIGNGRDLDLDVRVLRLEALNRLLLILRQAGFGLLVVPEPQHGLVSMRDARHEPEARGRKRGGTYHRTEHFIPSLLDDHETVCLPSATANGSSSSSATTTLRPAANKSKRWEESVPASVKTVWNCLGRTACTFDSRPTTL